MQLRLFNIERSSISDALEHNISSSCIDPLIFSDGLSDLFRRRKKLDPNNDRLPEDYISNDTPLEHSSYTAIIFALEIRGHKNCCEYGR